jgi:hypothetical protein
LQYLNKSVNMDLYHVKSSTLTPITVPLITLSRCVETRQFTSVDKFVSAI